MKTFKFLSFLFFVMVSGYALAESPVQVQKFQNLINHKNWSFVENKGQLMDENQKSLNNVKYYTHQGNVNVFCKPGMVSFVFRKIENESHDGICEASGTLVETQNFASLRMRQQFSVSKISTARMDLVLIGSNPNSKITASDQLAYYENYYTTGDANKGIINVHTYKTISYREIYPRIDMILSAKETGVEYSFLVHPGGKVRDIKLKWNGAQNIKSIANGCIRYDNQLGNLIESAPTCFVNGKTINSSLVKNGNIHTFHVGKYDKSKDLLIDPDLIWATYFGGNDVDYSNDVTSDDSDNVIITGQTKSTSLIATSGAYQTINGGGNSDAFLAKFNKTGALLWATYIGGSGTDNGTKVNADRFENIYITGQTSSTSGMATHGAFQTSYGGGKYDAFLAKFNGAGVISWASYMGGGGEDGGNGLVFDSNTGVFLAGYSTSTNGIATSGMYQTTNAGGSDVFLAKFDISGNMSWCTYYGGENNDYVAGIKMDISGDIIMSGNSSSTTGIATTGAYQTTANGNSFGVAYISKFHNDGKISWATYFGTNGYNQSIGVGIDILENIYISGQTVSQGIATSNAHQTSIAGLEDTYLAKFTKTGTLDWATYYGGAGNDIGTAIAVDSLGNAYIAGNTLSANGIATTGAYQSVLVAGKGVRAFAAKFNTLGTQLWGTYFGGDITGNATQAIYGISADNSGNLYAVGYTQASSGIATSGAYQITFGGAYDGFLAKFNLPNASAIKPEPDVNLFDLKVSPNPFIKGTDVYVDFSLQKASLVKIQLVDLKGSIIFSGTGKKFEPGKNESNLNTFDLGLEPGTYFLNLEINGQIESRKIIEIK